MAMAADLLSNSVAVCAIGVVVDDGADVTAGPDGGVPMAVAVLLTDPRLTSVWLIVRVAVHVVVAPGASVVDGQVMLERPTSGSLMVTAASVTLPVLETVNENVCVSPNDGPVGAASVVTATVLDRVIVLVWEIGVVVDELFDVTPGPVGGVPLAVAVLLIVPAFTSDWVIVRVAVQVVDAPGANVVDGQLIADNPVSGSAMFTEVSVTLPVFVTAKENVCVSPNDAPAGAVSAVIATVFTNDNVLVCAIGVDVDELFDVTAGPEGGVPDAVAVLAIAPAFTSVWVIARVAEQVVNAPGVNVVDGQVIADRPGSRSVMLTEVRVTLPVLVTAKENVCMSPKDAPVGAVSVVIETDFNNVIVLVWVIGVVVDELLDVTAGPVGGVPDADAVLMIDPAFTSAWVIVRVAVHVLDDPGASVVDGQVILERPANGSVMVTDVNVTLPVFVTKNANVCTSSNDAPVGAVSVVIAAVLLSVVVAV